MSAVILKEEASEVPKYQPIKKIESIDEIDEASKTQLEKAYTIWVMMKQDKNIEEEQYANVLKPVSTFKTVLYKSFIILIRWKTSGLYINI